VLVLVALVTTVMTVPVLSLLDRGDGKSRTTEETREGEEPVATLN
jgi:hypothetical protein